MQLPIGIPIDLPIVELYDIEQIAQIVNEQVTMVSQATKAKAKGGKKRNKVANKVTLKPLEDPIIFVPPSPIGLPHMGQPPPIPHLGTHTHNITHMLLSHFYPMIEDPPFI